MNDAFESWCIDVGRQCSLKSPDEKALLELEILSADPPHEPWLRDAALKLLHWESEPWAPLTDGVWSLN